jgi:hypothetical protein
MSVGNTSVLFNVGPYSYANTANQLQQSYYFPGSSYLQTYKANTANVAQFGNGDFTIEGWLRANSTSTMGIIDLRPGVGSPGVYLTMTNETTIAYISGSTTMLTSGTGTNFNTAWGHFALVRKAAITTLYINGTQSGPAVVDSGFYANTANNIWVGSSYGGASTFTGMMSDIRITNGTGRYTSNSGTGTNAWVPTIPYTNH